MKKVLISLVFIFVVVISMNGVEAATFFESSWNTATGKSDAAITDGGKWGHKYTQRKQDPEVFSGGPGGNNYLNMVTVNDQGEPDPRGSMEWWPSENENIFQDPPNLYFRVYFRLHDDHVLSRSIHWITVCDEFTGSHIANIFNTGARSDYQNANDWSFEVEEYDGPGLYGAFTFDIPVDWEQWYCYEFHMEEIDSSGQERWYIRLDGEDITDTSFCHTSGCQYSESLTDAYNRGAYISSFERETFFITTYDAEELDSGWDVAALRFDDDNWIGPVVCEHGEITYYCTCGGQDYQTGNGYCCNNNWQLTSCGTSTTCDNGNCDLNECRTCPQDCSLQDCDGIDGCNPGVGETCDNSNDCACSSPDQCCSGSCQTPACSINSDCGSVACTTYTCSNPDTCTASCSSQSITQCLNSDQCCPPGCTITNDDDCSGCQTVGDCSDRSCQTKACTNNVCVYSPVGCSNNDGCCPSGCTSTNDDDCPTQGGSGTETWGDSQDSDHPGTVQDTYIDVGEADQNFATDVHLNTYTWPVNTAANAIVIKWDLSAIPASSTITSAVLQLYMDSMEHFDTTDDPYDIPVHKITGVNPNPATTTWDTPWTSPGGQNDIASPEDTTPIDKVYEYKSWSVTDMVRDWVSNPQENRGMLLNSDLTASRSSNRYFASSENTNQNQRPKLTITYSGSGTGAIHPADNNPQNGCVLENELTAYITLWKQDSTAHPMREMMRAISLWRSGTGCT